MLFLIYFLIYPQINILKFKKKAVTVWRVSKISLNFEKDYSFFEWVGNVRL